jgi:hypothetical protein
MQTGKFVSDDVEDQTEQVKEYKSELIAFHFVICRNFLSICTVTFHFELGHMRFNFPNHVLEMCIRQFMEGKKSSFELKENKKKATLQYNNQYNVNPLRPLTS